MQWIKRFRLLLLQSQVCIQTKISQVFWDIAPTSSSSAIPAKREDVTVASSAVRQFTRVSTTQNEFVSHTHVDAIMEITSSYKFSVKELRKIALELINTGRWLHPLALQLQQTAPSGHNFGWKTKQLRDNCWEHSYNQKALSFESLMYKMGKTVGYPLKQLLVIYLLSTCYDLFLNKKKRKWEFCNFAYL